MFFHVPAHACAHARAARVGRGRARSTAIYLRLTATQDTTSERERERVSYYTDMYNCRAPITSYTNEISLHTVFGRLTCCDT